MDPKDKENDIEKLTLLLSRIQNLYYKKQEQLEEIQLEISELKEALNVLNSLISNKSFRSADEIYSASLKIVKNVENVEQESAESYFKENISKEKLKGTSLKGKIFSETKEEEAKLLCVLNFIDLNNLKILFADPEFTSIKETSEAFINIFLKEALLKIKEKNPNLERSYKFYKDSDIIESIEVSNLNSVEDYYQIYNKMYELLTGKKPQTTNKETRIT